MDVSLLEICQGDPDMEMCSGAPAANATGMEDVQAVAVDDSLSRNLCRSCRNNRRRGSVMGNVTIDAMKPLSPGQRVATIVISSSISNFQSLPLPSV